LAQQAVGIFIAASLLGALGIAKENVGICATVKRLCIASSVPRSQVSEVIMPSGSYWTCRIKALTTLLPSLPLT